MKTSFHSAFTLVELLLVVAIAATVSAGVVVTYANVAESSRRQATLREMGEIRDAFAAFWADNSSEVMSALARGPDRVKSALELLESQGLALLSDRSGLRCYSSASGEGWRGPYISSLPRDAAGGMRYRFAYEESRGVDGERSVRSLCIVPVDGSVEGMELLSFGGAGQ